MLTYDEAKKMVLEDCKSATGVDHIVSSAWELPDSFVFGCLPKDEGDRGSHSYAQVFKDEQHPDFDLSPVHLTAYTREGRARIRSLSTKNARRIV